MKHFLFLFVCVSFSESVKLPANFIKCNRNEPNLNSCLLKAAKNGVSQLTKAFPVINLPNLDPLDIPEIVVEAGKEPVNVHQHFKNCKLYGVDKIKLDKFEINFDKQIFDAAGYFPEVKKTCVYEVNGRVLLLPIVGKGPSTVILKNVNVSTLLNYKEAENKGKTYLKFISSKLMFDPGFVFFNFENLFNGDKELGDNINYVLNENWREVFADIKDGYAEVFNRVIVGLLKISSRKCRSKRLSIRLHMLCCSAVSTILDSCCSSISNLLS